MSRSSSTFFFVLLASLVALAIAGNASLIDTKEYQLSLNGKNFEGTSKRQDTIKNYLETIQNKLKVDLDKDFETKINLRNEGTFDLSNCNAYDAVFIRLRTWFSGPGVGLHSIDIKYGTDGQTRSEATDAPLQPSDKYADQADQDVEEDIHTCYRDYSRTTKVFFEPGTALPAVETCGDLRDIFPGAFESDKDDESTPLVFSKPYTYIYKLEGTMPSGSAIEFTFTLEHDSPEDAEEAKNANSGEFSITYAATGDGFSDFESSELENVEKLYKSLFKEFGSHKDEDCSSGEDADNSNSNNSNSDDNNDNDDGNNDDSSDANSVIPCLMAIFLVSLAVLF